jgi:hypothetical protein
MRRPSAEASFSSRLADVAACDALANTASAKNASQLSQSQGQNDEGATSR